MKHSLISLFCLIALVGWTSASSATAASISDFSTWALVQDPPNANMTASLDSSTQTTLTANGAVPAGVDIGYQSVDGNETAGSTAGYFFSAADSFQVAVDFDVVTDASAGLAAIGMGIGEDGAGSNSAGPALAVVNGVASTFSGGARTGDITLPPALFGPAATLSGRFFVAYDSATGDVEYGVSTTPGAAAPTHTGVFDGLQNNWNDKDLLVSFFLRSDMFIFPPLSSGTVDAVFSNFEVLSGTPVAAIPEPAAATLLLAAAAAVAWRPRRARRGASGSR